ncbi:hypothetical protein [Dyadobacter sp. 676]|uniref:SMI1/KNR4 family protein n=1 Tax=Dyadobacter sp. 676 TaxID=3088362 RepID=A0AAU8FV20_9BACT
MEHHKLNSLINQVKDLLGVPYPTAVGEPLENTYLSDFTNFLRSGPERKVILFNYECGDYDYDETLSVDDEIKIIAENDGIYDQAQLLITQQLGQPLPFEEVIPFRRSDFDMVQNATGNGIEIEITPEYFGGALFENTDDTTFCCWQKANEYLSLQKGAWWRGGNFFVFSLATITPM